MVNFKSLYLQVCPLNNVTGVWRVTPPFMHIHIVDTRATEETQKLPRLLKQIIQYVMKRSEILKLPNLFWWAFGIGYWSVNLG